MGMDMDMDTSKQYTIYRLTLCRKLNLSIDPKQTVQTYHTETPASGIPREVHMVGIPEQWGMAQFDIVLR
ncbi:hypothetical protein N7475_003404 [Penicillium sp. IBT 31633x]|nr:hypothetical protein N7475_003404 [Penicillium sp. IBT 31633x]